MTVPTGQPAGQHQFRGRVANGLNGTGQIADDLYLLGHNDRTGRPAIKPRSLGIGLAGALLAELMLEGSISFQRDGVVAHGRWPADELGQKTLSQIAAEPRPVRDWLLFFSLSANGDVARRLERAGYLQHVSSWLPGRPDRLVPVDVSWAYVPLLRARSALDPTRPFNPHRAVLAGLAGACGLGFRLASVKEAGDRTVEEAAGQLTPGLRYLIIQAQAAAGSAVQSQRA